MSVNFIKKKLKEKISRETCARNAGSSFWVFLIALYEYKFKDELEATIKHTKLLPKLNELERHADALETWISLKSLQIPLE